MRFKLENRHVMPAIRLLDSLELAGKQSRARTRLASMLTMVAQQIGEAEYQLIREHTILGDDGKPVEADGGGFTPKTMQDMEAYVCEHGELMGEMAQVEQGTYEGHRSDCIALLEGETLPLSGEQADAYDALLTALEEGED